MKFFLKVKASAYNYHQTFKIDKLPCSLGRSLENDIVLDDKSVSRYHAIIKYDEKAKDDIILIDSNSTNGTWVNAEHISIHSLSSKEKFEIGPYEIEFLSEKFTLEDTAQFYLDKYFPTARPEEAPHNFLSPIYNLLDPKTKFKSVFIYIAIYLIVLLIGATFNLYLDANWDSDGFKKLLTSYLLSVCVFFGISGVISLNVKIVKGRFEFLPLLHLQFKIFIIFIITEIIMSLSYFNITQKFLINIIDYIISLVFLIFVFYGYIRIIYPRFGKGKVLLFVITAIFSLSGLYTIYDYYNYDNKSYSLNFYSFMPIRTYSADKFPLSELNSSVDESIKKVIKYRHREIERKEKYAKTLIRNYSK